MDLSDFVSLAEILGSIATAGAFWVTWLTLRELKRQTDLANNPALKIRFRYFEKLPVNGEFTPAQFYKNHLKEHPHTQWLTMITRNLDQDISGLQDEYLVIELTNSGKSEITRVKMQVHLNVMMFDNDIIGYPLGPSDYDWNIEQVLDLDERQSAYIPITNTRYFPIHSFRIISLEFFDVRGTEYNDFDGPGSIRDSSHEVLRPRLLEHGEHDDVEQAAVNDVQEEAEPPIDNDDDDIPF